MDEELPVQVSDDIVRVRQQVRSAAVASGLSLVDQTKIITAASEIARNALIHGGGGSARIETSTSATGRPGIRITFTDDGPGIPDVALALKDGWSSGNGLGLGLSGARRLVDEFDLATEAGAGTSVVVAKWSR
jgi:serine/threonine-protein kinase RsbT